MDIEGGERPRALLLFPGALGDAVCLEPTVRWLARQGSVILYARGASLEVASLFPGQPERRSLDGPEIARLFAPLGAEREAPPAWLEGFTRIVSFTGARCEPLRRRLEGAARALVLPFPGREGREHVVRELFAGATGESPDSVCPSALLPRLVVPGSNERSPGGVARPLLVLHPGSGGRAKRASMRVQEALAARWRTRMSGGVLVLLGPAEEGEDVRWEGLVDRVERPASIARLAGAIANADAYLGNDSGPSHVAAALGRPTTVLHVATDPERFGPRGPHVTHVVGRPDDEGPLIEGAWSALAAALP